MHYTYTDATTTANFNYTTATNARIVYMDYAKMERDLLAWRWRLWDEVEEEKGNGWDSY